jgi:hypothetical protein
VRERQRAAKRHARRENKNQYTCQPAAVKHFFQLPFLKRSI